MKPPVTRPRSILAALAALSCVGLGLVAGCGAGSGGQGEDAGAAADSSSASRNLAAAEPLSSTGASGGAASAVSQRAAPVQTRAVISTGSVVVATADVGSAHAEVVRLVHGLGGYLDRDSTRNDKHGRVVTAAMTIRVPARSFDAAMQAVGAVGTEKYSQARTKDVTTQVIDVDSRVRTARQSLVRLHGFLRQAQNVRTLVALEQQITERTSELQSLSQQRAYLADQTSLATIDLRLQRPDAALPAHHRRHTGFVPGLSAGWHALVGAGLVVLTAAGALLPWAVLVALVGVPALLLTRRMRRPSSATEG